MGALTVHDDDGLSNLGNNKDVLLKHEMMMAGLEGLTIDDAKKDCACCGMESCEVQSTDAISNGNSNSDMMPKAAINKWTC